MFSVYRSPEYAGGNFTEEMPPLIEALGSVGGESDTPPGGAGRAWRDGSEVSSSVVEVMAVPEIKTNTTGLGGERVWKCKSLVDMFFVFLLNVVYLC